MPENETDKEGRKTTQLRIEADLLANAGRVAKKRRMSQNAYLCLAVENQVKADAKLLKD